MNKGHQSVFEFVRYTCAMLLYVSQADLIFCERFGRRPLANFDEYNKGFHIAVQLGGLAFFVAVQDVRRDE